MHSFTGLIFYKNKFSKQYSEFLVAIKFRIKEHQLLHTLHIRTIAFLKTPSLLKLLQRSKDQHHLA